MIVHALTTDDVDVEEDTVSTWRLHSRTIVEVVHGMLTVLPQFVPDGANGQEHGQSEGQILNNQDGQSKPCHPGQSHGESHLP